MIEKLKFKWHSSESKYPSAYQDLSYSPYLEVMDSCLPRIAPLYKDSENEFLKERLLAASNELKKQQEKYQEFQEKDDKNDNIKAYISQKATQLEQKDEEIEESYIEVRESNYERNSMKLNINKTAKPIINPETEEINDSNKNNYGDLQKVSDCKQNRFFAGMAKNKEQRNTTRFNFEKK